MTDSGHPVSIFSRIHSSAEKGYRSANFITFSAIKTGAQLFEKATFVMDRGYDDNKMFTKLEELRQNYVIRLTQKRKLFFHGKWVPATEVCSRRKGKVKLPLFYHGKKHTAYLSHVKVKITASKKDVYLVLVYGITEHPMMLVTNQAISFKEDVIKVAKMYFSCWRIEEYFGSIPKKYIFITIVFRPAQLVSLPSQKKAFGNGSKRNVPAIDNCVLYFWNDNFQSICYLSHDHGTSCRTHFYKIFVLIYIFY